MNWVDLLVLGVIGLSALFGFVRGLVREVLGIGAWIGAIVLAVLAYPWASSEARGLIANSDIAKAVALIGVFLVCLIALSLIAAWIGGVVRESALGGLDRMLGLVFGVARGVALIMIAYIVVGLAEAPAVWPRLVLEARALPYAYHGATWMVHLLPPRYRPEVAPPPSPTTDAKNGANAKIGSEPQGPPLDPPGPQRRHE